MKDLSLFFVIVLLFMYNVCKAQSCIIVMDNNTPIGMQTYFNSGSGNGLQGDEIKSYWDKDYYITAVAHGALGWFVSMSQGVKWKGQSYSYQDHWPDDWVFQRRGEGKFISSLASSDNRWLVVASSNTDYTAQEICAAPWNQLKEWISKWWNNDYYITSIACQNGLWTVVMSKTNIYKNQSYFWATSIDKLKEKISEQWNSNYYITALEYGNGEYFCIMSKYSDEKSRLQHWKIGSSDYKKDIKDYWDKSYRITYLGG